MAALVNGTMVLYLDANDISASGGGRFSDGILPLLAVAQNRGLSADEPKPPMSTSPRDIPTTP